MLRPMIFNHIAPVVVVNPSNRNSHGKINTHLGQYPVDNLSHEKVEANPKEQILLERSRK